MKFRYDHDIDKFFYLSDQEILIIMSDNNYQIINIYANNNNLIKAGIISKKMNDISLITILNKSTIGN